MNTSFDAWMAEFGEDTKPTDDELKELAESLLHHKCGPPPPPVEIASTAVVTAPASIWTWPFGIFMGFVSLFWPRRLRWLLRHPPRITTNNIVSWQGVTVDWFQNVFMGLPEVQCFSDFGCRMWFVRNHGIKAILTRRGVVSGCFLNHIHQFDTPTWCNESRQEQKGHVLKRSSEATAFVSYTGSYTLDHFAELVGHDDLGGKYLWIDIFGVDQFSWTERKDPDMLRFKRNFMDELHHKIGIIGYTALMLNRYDDLMATLGQIWVIWEIFSTVDHNADLTMLLAESENNRFIQEGLKMGKLREGVAKLLAEMDAVNASSFDPKDKELIIDIMRQTDGVRRVNSTVTDRIRQWLRQEGEKLAQSSGTRVTSQNPEMISNLALLYLVLGEANRAETLLRQVLATYRERLGYKHKLTLETLGNIAKLTMEQGRMLEAEPLFREVMGGFRETLGERDVATLKSINNMAGFLSVQGKLSEAKSLYQESLQGFREALGDQDPDTLRSITFMADLLFDEGKVSEAEPLYREAMLTRTKTLGRRHSDTLDSMSRMASLFLTQSKLPEAERLFKEEITERQQTFGSRHPETLRAANNLADVLAYQGKLSEAASICWETLIARREILGDLHPDTLKSVCRMGGILATDYRSLDQARALFEEGLDGCTLVFGPQHSMTLQSREALNLVEGRIEGARCRIL